MTALFLLSTDGCHLCEIAKELLNSMQLGYEVVDIIADEQLVREYGDKIPVLIADNASQALFWPFDQQSINQYKEHYGIS